MSIAKKFWMVLAILIIVLLVTNPSTKAFKDYLGPDTNHHVRKLHNFFIFSIYKEEQPFDTDQYSDQYLGIFGNFFARQSK
jgi:hypothetical protein